MSSEKDMKGKSTAGRYMHLVIAYGMYLYAFLLFFDKGDGIKNLSLYATFSLILILIYIMKEVRPSTNLISYGILTFAFSVLLSSVFSIKPIYSVITLKKEFWKGILLFLTVSMLFRDRMLLRLGSMFSLAGVIMLVFGLHGFLVGDSSYYTSDNMFLPDADKNKYGFIIAFVFPFILLSFSTVKGTMKKTFWGLVSIWVIVASVLSASRGAIVNVLAVILIWSVFTLRKRHLIFVPVFILALSLAVTATFNSWPEPVKQHITDTKDDIWTFKNRTVFFWKPALQSVAKKPLIGWGYGKDVYRDPEPFEDTEKPKKELKGGLHNQFITVLFHQGVFGLASYLLLLLSSLYLLAGVVSREDSERRFLALALISVIIGSFFLNSFVKVIPFRPLGLVLGMSSALMFNGKHKDP